jgi:hypothetical protein
VIRDIPHIPGVMPFTSLPAFAVIVHSVFSEAFETTCVKSQAPGDHKQ